MSRGWSPPTGVAGRPREAAAADRDLLVAWSAAFQREALADHPHSNPAAPIDGRLALGGLLWVWEAGGEPVSMAAMTAPAAGVVRLNLVYTPPRRRGNGYAGALVAAVSAAVLTRGAAPDAVHRPRQPDQQQDLPGDRLPAGAGHRDVGGRLGRRAGRDRLPCAISAARSLPAPSATIAMRPVTMANENGSEVAWAIPPISPGAARPAP